MGLWVLILVMHTGAWSKNDSNSMAIADGFISKTTCEIAGKSVVELAKGTTKEIKFSCVRKD